MAHAYLCPICRKNRTQFALIYKFSQEVQLDAETGEVTFEAPELETVQRADGRPDIDVRCLKCEYTASESTFIQSRRREDPPQVKRRRAASS